MWDLEGSKKKKKKRGRWWRRTPVSTQQDGQSRERETGSTSRGFEKVTKRVGCVGGIQVHMGTVEVCATCCMHR